MLLTVALNTNQSINHTTFFNDCKQILCKLTYVNLYLLTDTLRALYMGDNDFEVLPDEIGKLKNLQIVSFYNLSMVFQVIVLKKICFSF